MKKIVVLMSWEGHSRVPAITLHESYADVRKRFPDAPEDGEDVIQDYGAVEWTHHPDFNRLEDFVQFYCILEPIVKPIT